MSIKIREKILKNGDKSLYLDIYHNSKRYYEFLDLRIYNKPNKFEKLQNKENLNLAYQIKIQRESDLNHQKHNILNPKSNKILLLSEFYKYFENIKSINTKKLYQLAYNHLESYINQKPITLKNADESFFRKFMEYLSFQGISNNSIKHYSTVIKAFFNHLIKNKVILENPINDIKIKTVASHKIYLTKDEIEILFNNFDESKEYQRAFLFACFTGLRFSDIFNLKYSNIESIRNKDNSISYEIVIKMMKSDRKIQRIPVNQSAQKLIDVSCKDEKRIFTLSKDDVNPDDKEKINKVNVIVNHKLKTWFMQCKLMKKGLSFHSARHSFAIMLLQDDVSIYDVSKLLGHSDLKITQIYADILSEKQQLNVSKINIKNNGD